MEGAVKDRELEEAVARSCAAVAQVRAEVDKLSELVSSFIHYHSICSTSKKANQTVLL